MGDTLRGKVFTQYMDLLSKRRSALAFHPLASQTILNLSQEIFAVLRQRATESSTVLALHNVTGESVSLILPYGVASIINHDKNITLAPYEVRWIMS